MGTTRFRRSAIAPAGGAGARARRESPARGGAPSANIALVHRGGLTQDELERLAERLGASLRGGEVLLLEGEMGAGKTTFTRALARGLRVERPDRVCSPTYTICMVHDGPRRLVHLDLFRFGDEAMAPLGTAALESLGLEHDELVSPGQVLVVEWSQLWGEPPPERLEIRLTRAAEGPNLRNLDVTAAGERSPRVLEEWLGKAAKNGLITTG